MADNIHIGDIGTIFTVTIKDEDGTVVDVSTDSTQEIICAKPNGDTVTQTSSFTTDGTDGKIQFTTTAAGDLDKKGKWHLQGKVVITAGTWRTNIGHFKVFANL